MKWCEECNLSRFEPLEMVDHKVIEFEQFAEQLTVCLAKRQYQLQGASCSEIAIHPSIHVGITLLACC